MKIEITDGEVTERTVSHEKGSFTVREQEGFLFMTDDAKYPTRFTLQVSEGSDGWKPGLYELAPSSFFVNRFGQLTLKRELDLKFLAKAAA